MNLSAEQIDALSAGDLGVEAVFLRNRADRDELVGRDFAAWHARHDGIGSVFLHVCEEVVVRILQHCLVALQHELVPARGEDRGDDWFADVAAEAAAVLRQRVAEGLELADADEVEELLPRVREVLAQVVGDRDATGCELGLEELSE